MGKVVSVSELGDGIAQITMHDRECQNTFSDELIEGLIVAFRMVRENEKYKVVVLTGYDNYFCCGGTKEDLMKIYRGEVTFNDLQFFTLPLECEIPVVSAMQGHGIGGGFAFGLYADFAILGRENIYTTNFMKYGFTPGMGVTLVVPARLGNTIGNEMLFTARNYRGAELQERGIPMKVVPKSEVLAEAISLARILAEKPRVSLVAMKEHMTLDLRRQLPKFIEKELEMHSLTFHQPEVAQRIEALFGG